MERQNRTIVCSVLFLDIVEYSKRSVSEQMRQKQRFNDLLAQALCNVSASDRIVLDTGDGAAVSFLGNPEDALFAAMSLRDAVMSWNTPEAATMSIRIGINLGPVRMIKDLNGQFNIIGDGINVAQRVMGFTDPGEIFISRSYHEVISRLSPEFSQLFQYVGARTDKHVREHEMYSVGPTSAELRSSVPLSAMSGSSERAAGLTRSRPLNKRLFVALPFMMLVIIASGGVIRMLKGGAPAETEIAAAPEKSSKRSVQRPGMQSPQAVRNNAAGQSSPGIVRLAIVPWGEVFVDGKRRGVSPPLRYLEIGPGLHTIEVRNTSFPVFSHTLQAKSGEQITIRHRFN